MAEMRISAPGFDIRRKPTTREAVMSDLRRRDNDLAIGPLAAAPDALVLTESIRLDLRTGRTPADHQYGDRAAGGTDRKEIRPAWHTGCE
ncbi:hypothetical protein EFD55_09515 [Rhizobium pisi]|nr:hypothetical protein EFD55_09515 [Rhizobium pisi]